MEAPTDATSNDSLARMRWPVEEMGRNSVMPSMMPRRMLATSSSVSGSWLGFESDGGGPPPRAYTSVVSIPKALTTERISSGVRPSPWPPATRSMYS